jgi:flagellar biosynthesis/type III secretory pathway chaperone
MLSSGKLDPNKAGELAEYVVVIRSLVKQLDALDQRIEKRDPVSPLNRLREDYLELEGMVKEIRNCPEH